MKKSNYLYGSLDRETAEAQLLLFKRKKDKAKALLGTLKVGFNLLAFTEEQRQLEYRIVDIKKALEFCDAQIQEAKEVLDENK